MSFVEMRYLGANQQMVQVILNRPEARNAFTTNMAHQILAVFQTINFTEILLNVRENRI